MRVKKILTIQFCVFLKILSFFVFLTNLKMYPLLKLGAVAVLPRHVTFFKCGFHFQ